MSACFFVHTNFSGFVCWLYVLYVRNRFSVLDFFGSLNVCENLCMLRYADLLCMFCMFIKVVSALWNYSDFLRQMRCTP